MKTKNKKTHEELLSKIRELISSVTKSTNDYFEEYMRIKFNSNDELPLNKMIEIHSIIIVFRAVIQETNKYYPRVS